MRTILKSALLASVLLAPTASFAADEADQIVTSQHSFTLTKVASGLEHPWGLDWLPDGRIVVTERPGRLRLVSADGSISAPISGLPEIVSEFRDGLLDVSVSPDFADDSLIFFSYSKKDGDDRWLEIASARLNGTQLSDVTVIHAAEIRVQKDQGFGSRIRFDGAGDLVISVGDHAAAANAQDPSNTLGSIIRISKTGAPVASNPGKHLAPAVYAYGFKNPQGLTIHPITGTVWVVDHGGKGGGELNSVTPGGNYGWPTRTFSGGDAPRAATDGDFVDPVFTWGAAPTVALSGLEVYSGTEFDHWSGDLFTGSLTQEALIRIMINDFGAVVGIERVIDEEIGRIREVRQGPDGRLYVLNDDPEGGIYRIDPTPYSL